MAVWLLACALLGRSALGSGVWLEVQNATAAGHVLLGVPALAGGYCAVDELVNCTYGNATCSGNQCCPRAPGDGLNKTYPCPSSDPDFVDCEVREKVGSCLDPAIAKATVRSSRTGTHNDVAPPATPPPPAVSTTATTTMASQTRTSMRGGSDKHFDVTTATSTTATTQTATATSTTVGALSVTSGSRSQRLLAVALAAPLLVATTIVQLSS